MKAILTFDLEFWHNSRFIRNNLPQNPQSQIQESTKSILSLLEKYKQKATFFVLGPVAQKHPEIIEEIFNAGHEIASHGYSHKTLNELTPQEFEKEIIETNEIIEKIIGKKPIGFRAPNFSLNHKTKWALDILKKHGFKYDSSLFCRNASFNSSIAEIPSSLGGIYFRVLPFKTYLYLIKNKPAPYFHPYDFFPPSQIKSIPWMKRKIKYWGTKNALNKFEELLKRFDFNSIDYEIFNHHCH